MSSCKHNSLVRCDRCSLAWYRAELPKVTAENAALKAKLALLSASLKFFCTCPDETCRVCLVLSATADKAGGK